MARRAGCAMIRLGLCCIFRDEPIRFRRATAAGLARMTGAERLARLGALCLANAESLHQALVYCAGHGIGSFRVNSQILPLATHPVAGYRVRDLPDGAAIERRFLDCGALARRHGLRTTFHPDQFVLLNSPRPEVVEASLRELEYQAEVAEWIGADVLNIHAGGGYGDKPAALRRLAGVLGRVPDRVRARLTIENDDRLFAPRALAPFCRAARIPLVYDVHHHRCLADGWSVERATDEAASTWDREQLVHVSSPRDGWGKPAPQRHHEYIRPRDFPVEWLGRTLTIDVEAKAKEAAVARLARHLAGRGVELFGPGCGRSPGMRPRG